MNWQAAHDRDRVAQRGSEAMAGTPRPGRKTTRRAPPRECPVSESEPIEIAKMWRDRRGNALVFSLKSYEGRPFFDARLFFTDSDGRLKPTAKGITAAPRQLPEIAKAIAKAMEKAAELGLIDEAEGGE
ncbi:transcriptional coactivator p15/PC4 family protein [Bradyrhizobium sp. STM 3843]|uniref:transcriptional coactivator p15/PC4 family protein n=1 Tax=Bradyrhizobium sp. STM 3843 TaxID=551947 RepID=UPI0002E1F16D|nr:transcriptional coactivator p15/PC4 family protein [Bradyrhizobium sp. STM 3843]